VPVSVFTVNKELSSPQRASSSKTCYADTAEKKKHMLDGILDDLPASSMAELGDTFHATMKLEELKTKLREGRLRQPNHADADVLLRAYKELSSTDTTVAALVPIISANKVPREVHAPIVACAL
jgi:hypothetical protein